MIILVLFLIAVIAILMLVTTINNVLWLKKYKDDILYIEAALECTNVIMGITAGIALGLIVIILSSV